MLWTAEPFNYSATSASAGTISLHEVLYERRPSLPLLSFVQPAYHPVLRKQNTDPHLRPCLFLNFDYGHGHDFLKMIDDQTREPLIPLAQTPKAGTVNRTPTPEFVFIPPLSAVPVPARARAPTPTTIAPPSSTVSAPLPASINCSCTCTYGCTFTRARAYRYTFTVDAPHYTYYS